MRVAGCRLRSGRLLLALVLFLSAATLHISAVQAQTSLKKDAILLTIFLKHDESKTLDEIRPSCGKTAFTRNSRHRGWRWSRGMS